MSNINTNNSLTDIANGGGKFNSLLDETNISNANKRLSDFTDPLSNLNSLIAERDELKKQYISSSDDFSKDLIEKRIEEKTAEIDKIKNVNITSLESDNNKSIFDRKALVDYGRSNGVSGYYDGIWNEYGKKNDVFITNNSKSINTPAETDLSLNEDTGLDPQGLITWSEKYPALQLRLQDFVYCKRLGYYPNNRLIVLRRFKGAVPDNLYDYHTPTSKIEYTQPLATMVTWLKPDDDIIKLEFNENWEKSNTGIVDVIKSALGEKSGNSSFIEELGSDLIMNSLIKSFVKTKEDGTTFDESNLGKPNLIKESQKHITDGKGLSSKINFELEFEYELRDINGIDPNIVMLDLMSNAMRMGTSESEFLYNIPFFTDKNSTIRKFMNGDTESATKDFIDSVTKFTEEVEDNLKEFIKKGEEALKSLGNALSKPVETGGKIIKDSAKYIFSKYREDLKSAISADTGIESGIWHVTIGNPKSPIVSCGDLIVTNSTLDLGKEFGFNDFPNSFKVKYSVSSARTRGRQEIARIFNSGKGRLYVYPNAKDNPDYNMY